MSYSIEVNEDGAMQLLYNGELLPRQVFASITQEMKDFDNKGGVFVVLRMDVIVKSSDLKVENKLISDK